MAHRQNLKIRIGAKDGKKVRLLAVGLSFTHKRPPQHATLTLDKHTDHFVGEFEWNYLFHTYSFRPMWRVE